MKKLLAVAAIAIVVLALAVIAVSMLGVTDRLVGYAEALRSADADFLARHYLLALAIYALAFTVCVALCLPLPAVMAVIGGWLFGLWSLPVALLSILAGSVVPFLLSRRYAGPALAKVDSTLLAKFRRGFARNQLQYLILMRLVPWAPFTVTTIVAGALGMELTKFLIGTALGYLPAGLALAAIGHGFARLSDLQSLSASQLYSDPDFLIALAGVSAVLLLSASRRLPFVARLFR